MPVDRHAERTDDDNCRPKGRHGFRISPRPLRIAVTSQNIDEADPCKQSETEVIARRAMLAALAQVAKRSAVTLRYVLAASA
jgi:hypothetical protein